MLARLVAERITSALGQSVVVDNRGGGGGAIGAKAVAGADPDGYTLLFGNTATLANIPAVSQKRRLRPGKALRRRGEGDRITYQVLVVNRDLPVRSVAEAGQPVSATVSLAIPALPASPSRPAGAIDHRRGVRHPSPHQAMCWSGRTSTSLLR